MSGSLPATAPCPCGSGAAYADCCGPLHAGSRLAGQADELMRSRYTAYVLGREDYLLTTWHPRTRPAALGLSSDAAGATTKWLGLDLRRHVVIDVTQATVEFVARYRVGGARAVRLHETSRFERLDGRWYYVDGDIR